MNNAKKSRRFEVERLEVLVNVLISFSEIYLLCFCEAVPHSLFIFVHISSKRIYLNLLLFPKRFSNHFLATRNNYTAHKY